MHNKGDLVRAERLEIGILLEKKYSLRAIARALGRGHNTVSYEMRTNSTLGVYDPRKADAKARVRKHYRKLKWSKVNADPSLHRFVTRRKPHTSQRRPSMSGCVRLVASDTANICIQNGSG